MNSAYRGSNITKVGVFMEDGTYYLSIEGEDDRGIISIPKINIDSFILTQEDERVNGHILFARTVKVEMAVERDEEGAYSFYTKKTKPPKEMTVAQIQKELGYKIKIKE
jgi:hypothetical protein